MMFSILSVKDQSVLDHMDLQYIDDTIQFTLIIITGVKKPWSGQDKSSHLENLEY